MVQRVKKNVLYRTIQLHTPAIAADVFNFPNGFVYFFVDSSDVDYYVCLLLNHMQIDWNFIEKKKIPNVFQSTWS